MSASEGDIEIMSDDLDWDYSDSDKSDTESDNEIIHENKTRKRRKNKSLWKSVQRKHNLNSGLAYISTTGRNVPARQGYDCSCKNQCTSKILIEEKASILSKFNDLADKNVQDSYLFGLITVKSVARYVDT